MQVAEGVVVVPISRLVLRIVKSDAARAGIQQILETCFLALGHVEVSGQEVVGPHVVRLEVGHQGRGLTRSIGDVAGRRSRL